LNQGCVLVHDLESMLLRDPPQNRFSTVSVISGYAETFAVSPLYSRKADMTARFMNARPNSSRHVPHAWRNPASIQTYDGHLGRWRHSRLGNTSR
jgi:hypothetical protein